MRENMEKELSSGQDPIFFLHHLAFSIIRTLKGMKWNLR